MPADIRFMLTSDSEIKLPLILWNIPHAKCIHEMQAAAGFFTSRL